MTKLAKISKVEVIEPVVNEEEDDFDAKLLTLHEAEARVCPMGIGGESVSIRSNIVGKKCIADLCMGWRWGDDEHGFCGFVG